MSDIPRKKNNGSFERIDAAVDALFRFVRSTAAPPASHRLIASLLIATIAATFPYLRYLHDPVHPPDFALSWFGARALLHGGDPYVLIGPGRVYDWPWRLIYPATAFVAAMPLAFLPRLAASMTFVWLSVSVFAYAVLTGGWFRLVLFFTPAFTIAAGAAQWSPLLTTSLFFPWIGLLLAAKPNIGVAFGIAGSWRLRRNALIGSAILIAISLALLPSWPIEWIHSVREAAYEGAPVARRGGFVVLLVLLRWRRPETWLLLGLACVPQTTYWYEVLPLFLIPSSLSEIIALAGGCSIGAVAERFLTTRDDVLYNQQVGALVVAFVYLPAIILILKRRNESAPAPWSTKHAANQHGV